MTASGQSEVIIDDATFHQMLEKCGYRDMRKLYGSHEKRILQATLYRPCQPGHAVPPHLQGKWHEEKINTKKRDAIALKYTGNTNGIDAYIALLRIQIHWGLQLENVFDRQLIENPLGKASRVWHLFHHDFGQDLVADNFVKGLILYILSDLAETETYPEPNTLNHFLFENFTTMALYSRRDETALYNAKTLCRRTIPDSPELTLDEPFDFVKEAETAQNVLQIITYVCWEGKESLDELYLELVTCNLAAKFPLSSNEELEVVLPIFNKPLFQTIHYTQDPNTDQGSIETMRSFKVSGTVKRMTSTGVCEWGQEDATYHLFAIANLKQDVIRFYTPETAPVVESILPDPTEGDDVLETLSTLACKDTGKWKVGERDGEYLLVYRVVILSEGEEYSPPTRDLPEFISPGEFGRITFPSDTSFRMKDFFLEESDEPDTDEEVDESDEMNVSKGPEGEIEQVEPILEESEIFSEYSHHSDEL